MIVAAWLKKKNLYGCEKACVLLCSRGQRLSVSELPGKLFHNNELTEAVAFAETIVCMCVCAVFQMAYLLYTTTTEGL